MKANTKDKKTRSLFEKINASIKSQNDFSKELNDVMISHLNKNKGNHRIF